MFPKETPPRLDSLIGDAAAVRETFKIQKFLFKEMHLKMPSAKVAAILPAFNVLIGRTDRDATWTSSAALLPNQITTGHTTRLRYIS